MGVVNLRSGKPTMALTGGAAARLAAIVPAGMTPVIHVTITDEWPHRAGLRRHRGDSGGDIRAAMTPK